MNRLIFLCTVLMPFVLPSSAEGVSEKPSIPELEPKYFEDTLEKTHGKIIFSSILFRHGDRNPVTSFPTDRHKEYFERAGFGKLVKTGKQRAYRLGLWARARYAHLIQNLTSLEVLSSDRNRAIESAQMFLAAFWPPQSEEGTWNSTFPWQPVPVHTLPFHEDNLIALKAPCPRVSWEISQSKESPILKQFYEDLGENFFVHLENSTQLKIPRNDSILALSTLCRICDTLFGQQHFGLELPPWAEVVYPEPLRSIWDKAFQLLAYNDATKRLKGGPLLDRIIRSMVRKREAADRENVSTTNVFHVYSAHDTTLSVLLSTLGVFDGKSLPYSATVLIELRYKDGNHYVTILRRNSEEKAPTLLKLPNCEDPCTLYKFIQILSPFIPKNWKKECYSFEPDYNEILF